MEVVSNNFMPGDPRLIDHIVYELKAQGIFDHFRKECIADVDTKPAYQNLRQRVEGSVSGFLRTQRWRPDMNKNYVREMLRKNISESGFLETGVERIVDQVVNPKINTIFLPQVESVVYKFLGIEKPSFLGNEIKMEPNSQPTNTEEFDSGNLLPSDLETVSPDSETHERKPDTSNDLQKLNDSRIDDEESPPFEPLEESTSFMMHEDNSIDSHLSGFSGLASHDSNHSVEAANKIAPMEISNQDSQLSKQSSDDHLSIVMSDETDTKMEMNDDSSHSKTVNDSNSKGFDFLQDQTSSQEAKKSEDKPKNDEKKSDRHRSSDKHRSRSDSSKSESKDRKSDKDKKSDRDKKDHRDKNSRHSSKDGKERERKHSRGKSEKDEHKHDKDKNSKNSNSRHSSSSSRDKVSKKDSLENKPKENSTPKDSKPKEQQKKDSKVEESRPKHKDDSKSRSHSTSSNKSKSDSKTKQDKNKTDLSKPSKKDDKSVKREDKHQSKHSSSSKKDGKHEKKDLKRDSLKKDVKDDHYSSKGKKSSRRSTDRDSSDGHSGTQSSSSSFGDSMPSSQNQKTAQDSSTVNSGSSSGESGNSDRVENANDDVAQEEIVQIGSIQLPQVKLIKPKFASNIFEARRLMKIRKQISKIERQKQMELINSSIALNSSFALHDNDGDAAQVVTYEVLAVEDDKEEAKEEEDDSKCRPNILKKQSKNNSLLLSSKLHLNNSASKLDEEHQNLADEKLETLQLSEEEEEDKVDEAEVSIEAGVDSGDRQVISQASWDAIEAKLNSEITLGSDGNSESSELIVNVDNKTNPITLEDVDAALIYFSPKMLPERQRNLDRLRAEIKQIEESLVTIESASLKKQKKTKADGAVQFDGIDRKLPKIDIVDVNTGDEIVISPSKGIKRHVEDHTDIHNNNNRTNSTIKKALFNNSYENAQTTLPNRTTSKTKKAKIVDSTVNQPDNFSLPLSPAESDKSFTSSSEKKNEKNETKSKRNNSNISNRSLNNFRNQRYSSDDLYKPRLQFSSSRRRGTKVADTN